MDKTNIVRKPKKERWVRGRKHKYMRIGMLITEDESKFMKAKNYAPTAIMHEALKDLGYQEPEQKIYIPEKKVKE